MRSLLICFSLFLAAAMLNSYEPHFVTDPAISPDGMQICFVYNGDLWMVPFEGGKAQRLTATEVSEHGPCWSPDGQSIAFSSNREGRTMAYVMPATGGPARAVSRESLTVCDWFADSQSLLCCRYNLGWGTSLYKASLSGERPVLIAEIGDHFSTLDPANETVIFNRYGDAYREAYRGSTNGDLWKYDILSGSYTRLTDTQLTERYPCYSHASDYIYFCASDGARFQLIRAPGNDPSARVALTGFDIWSARDISIARQNDRIAFEVFDQIWCYDPDLDHDMKAKQVNIDISEDNWVDLMQYQHPVNSFEDFAVSGDELLVAFRYEYDLFVMPRKSGPARQVTTNQAGIEDLAFLADNRTVIFSQYADGAVNLFSAFIDSVLTVNQIDWYGRGKFNVDNFYRSSDSHWVIEYTDSTGSGRIAAADSLFRNIRPVLTDKTISTDFACSPDGSMALFAITRDDISVRELYLYDFKTESRRKVMNDDAWIYGITWLQDQKSVLFSRTGKSRQLCRLDLIPRDELDAEPDNWKEIFDPSLRSAAGDSLKKDTPVRGKVTKEKKLPLQYDQIAWERLEQRLIPIHSWDESSYAVQAVDDTSFYYFRVSRGKDSRTTLHKGNIYGKNNSEVSVFKQIGNYQFCNDKSLYYLDNDRLYALNLKSKTKAALENDFRYSYSLRTLNEKVFEQVWGIFGRNFYDPAMHDVDWPKLYNRFKPYLMYADRTNVLETIIEEMIGEINSSHTGYYPRSESAESSRPVAALGLEFDQRQIMPIGLIVSQSYPGSALHDLHGIRAGDRLYSVDGAILTAYTPLDSLLTDKVGQKIRLTFLRGSREIKAEIKGLTWSQNRELWQQDRLLRRRLTTDKLSDNRIGYVYIPRMSDEAYNDFISDLFTKNADKDALIIDIRGNSGGHIHNSLLDFLSKEPNAFTTGRRYGAIKKLTPGRTWTKPIALLIDEHSYSDAEIFPHLFKEAGLGTVIGIPTSGSVIGTWEVRLLDGSSMRMPGSGWFRLDGTNMEGNGAQPDILVDLTPEDIISENDTQLQKAVEVLLNQLK